MVIQFEEKQVLGIQAREFQVRKIGKKQVKVKKGTTKRKTGGYIINLKISSKTKGPSNRYMLGIKYIEEKKVQEFRQSGKEGTGKKGTIKQRSQ